MTGLEIVGGIGIGIALFSIEKLVSFLYRRHVNSVGGDGDNNTNTMENSNNTTTNGSAVGSGNAVVTVNLPTKEQETPKY